MGPFQDTIVAGLLGGTLVGTILAFIQFCISRADKKKEKNDKILASIDSLSEKVSGLSDRMDKEGADEARRRILKFDDELRRDVGHSEESFNQILDDVNFYSKYCSTHADYKNSKAVVAIDNIQKTYADVKKENSFL